MAVSYHREGGSKAAFRRRVEHDGVGEHAYQLLLELCGVHNRLGWDQIRRLGQQQEGVLRRCSCSWHRGFPVRSGRACGFSGCGYSFTTLVDGRFDRLEILRAVNEVLIPRCIALSQRLGEDRGMLVGCHVVHDGSTGPGEVACAQHIPSRVYATWFWLASIHFK